MFVVNLKLSKRGIATGITFIAALAVLAVSIFTSGGVAYPKGADTADRTAFLAKLGYNAESQTETATTIVIPESFGEVYSEYNSLQKSAGFDLGDFCGKKAVMYSYRISDFADYTEVFANVLVKDGKIIGGDISSIENDGFSMPIIEKNENLKELGC